MNPTHKYRIAVITAYQDEYERFQYDFINDMRKILGMRDFQRNSWQMKVDEFEYISITKPEQLQGHWFNGVIRYGAWWNNDEIDKINELIDYTFL